MFVLSPRAEAERIRTSVPGLNLNYLSIFSADAKGFFKDEGLENETIVIGGPAGIAALISGDVDYSGAGGSGLRAAVKGAPLKAIMYQTERPTWYLIVHRVAARHCALGPFLSAQGQQAKQLFWANRVNITQKGWQSSCSG